MEGMIGEIRMFGGDTAPRGWEFCRGQVLYISEHDSLFSVIGPTYGGDGIETFMLPDLGGRVAIGAGQGAGLTNRILGEKLGTESLSLQEEHLPAHVHAMNLTFSATLSRATIELCGINGAGGERNPGGNYLGKDIAGGTARYTPEISPLVTMDPRSIVIESLWAAIPEVRVSRAGGDETHTNIQPVLAVNFIICINGIYPSGS